MKNLDFFITRNINSLIKMKIRNKNQLVLLLLEVCSLLLTGQETVNQNYGEIKIDFEFNRIFFFCSNKIFSFNFPFRYTQKHDNLKSNLSIKNFEFLNIDSYIISVLREVFDIFNVFNKQIDLNELQTFLNIKKNEDGFDVDYEQITHIYMHLLAFEPGYLRYDKNANEGYKHNRPHLHPKNHIDFYYSKENSLKIGIDDTFELDLVKLVNKREDCLYLRVAE